MLAQVGDDAQDLADEGVEPLRVQAAAVALLARAASPAPRYMTRQSGSPGRAAGLNVISPSGWMRQRVLQAQQLRGRALERAVRRLRSVHSINTTSRSIRPVDGRRRDRRRRGVAGQVETGDDAGFGARRVGGRVFHVERVEHAVRA